MKLRLGIKRVGSIVFGRVLEQDESLRSSGTLACGGKIIALIGAEASPQLQDDAIYVRGCCNGEDNEWFAYSFDDGDEAIKAVEDIKLLVAKVNGKQDAPDDCGLEVIE